MNDENKTLEIGRTEARFESENEIALLTQDRNQRNLALGSAVGGPLLLLTLVPILSRARRREQLANSDLRLLNAELESSSEEILRQRDEFESVNLKMQELDAFKEGMMGMVVHDLKKPLNAVLALSDTQNLKPNNAPTTNTAGLQMLQLVENLLDVQKHEEASVPLELTACSARQLAEKAENEVSLLLKQKQQQLVFSEKESFAVRADAELIIRLVINLMTNANKLAPMGDELLLTCTAAERSGWVEMSLTGHGQGIPPDELERVFDRFSQVYCTYFGPNPQHWAGPFVL